MDYQQLTEKYHLPVYNRFPITLVKGNGSYLWDDEGNKYLDALAGIAVNSLGHCHPNVVEAVQEQVEKLMHISNFYYSKPQAQLLELLAELSELDRGFICNSGGEAMEACLKSARRYARAHQKNGPLITISNAFHGRTMATVSMGMDKYSKGYDPLLQGFKEIPMNNLEALDDAFDNQTLGVVIESIQGSGGLHVASQPFMDKVEELCNTHDALLIVDEVQTGIARTGKMFGFEHYGIQPDIIGLAKAMGGGFPIGAMVCSDKVAETLSYGDHGSTYGGNPLACAASLAALNTVIDDNLTKQAAQKGSFLKNLLVELSAGIIEVTDIRGKGLMIGVELSFDGRQVVEEMMQLGVLSNCTQGNIIRLVPPLTISKEDLTTLAEVLIASIKKNVSSHKTN
ncbi:aspartate aminotransferase family protein [Fodinibius halophilus]|uniref:Acetylornithine/succinylornithine family transaminase n=1 Tax=Fodinibius halophilus TaxID=1736908 RepID=A0A6M1SS31_9BACT|nr:acetylornithine/succinylornithine family transaminase [Fodinibius halophilus]NGP86738.1 acetylornithine/succinylornithine family transaminase [Fodinibius halophilus]